MQYNFQVSSLRYYILTTACLLGLLILFASIYTLLTSTSIGAYFNLCLSLALVLWSCLVAKKEQKLLRRQFQNASLYSDHFLLEHLPNYKGPADSAKISFDNIKLIQIRPTHMLLVFVRRHQWIGHPCDLLEPVGAAPRVQKFSLPLSSTEKKQVIAALKKTGIKLKTSN